MTTLEKHKKASRGERPTEPLIFEKHVDWVKLISDDDNYKNILQVKIQKEFKEFRLSRFFPFILIWI